MADEDWDSVITASQVKTAPETGNAWDTNRGFAPSAGRGRGSANQGSDTPIGKGLAGTMSNMQIMSTTGDGDDWGSPATAAPAQSSWGQSNSNGFGSRDEPRGGGFATGPRKCHKCQEEGHMARDCPSGGGGGGGFSSGPRKCHKCQEEGHMSRDCPNGGGGGRGPMKCYKCQEEGHMSKDCPQAGEGGGRGPMKCFKCQGEGHMSRDCPQVGEGGGRGPMKCYKCSEEGHMSKDCPNPGTSNTRRGCFKCGEEGHNSRECTNPHAEGGGGGDRKGCYKCGEDGHLARDCTNPSQPTEGADGKQRENYIPPDEDDSTLFDSGISTGVNFDQFDHVPLQVTGDGVPDYITSFESANLRQLLLDNIKKSGYSRPTPVQKGAIPAILARRDLIACAQTGSGKTAAYLVPAINILLETGCSGGMYNTTQSPEVVIMAPTRELAQQIYNESRKFCTNSLLKVVIMYGGTNVQYQRTRSESGCNILVATAGRLKHMVEDGHINFSGVKFFILDEADRMLDMGFGPVIETIAKHPTMPPVGQKQTLMFSATFPEDVQRLAWNYLKDYIFINTGVVGGTNPDVHQEFHEVPRNLKRNKLTEVLGAIGDAKTIIFVESKKTADFVASFLCNTNFQATSIHGDRLQSQREEALRDFRAGRRHLLVATNVCARGLDIVGVEYVINYDLPGDVEEYVHRIGRTGRVGNIGKSISFFDPDRDASNASKLVHKLAASLAEVPDFLQAAAGGLGFAVSSANSTFPSRDMRRFGGRDDGGLAAAPPCEAEDTWD